MPRFDHHIHTRPYSPDSQIDPRRLIKQAQRVGLDGVVITEHDFQWDPEEVEDLSRQASGLVILSGVEVSAIEGHFLVYGLPNLDDAPPGIALKDLLQVVRDHAAAIVAAHPFRWGIDLWELLERHGPAFDAIELVSNNVTPETRRLTEQVLDRYPQLAATGSSDAHELAMVGCYYSEFPDPITSMSDFVAALKSKRSRPRHTIKARLACGPVE